jgi:hypothetical protein
MGGNAMSPMYLIGVGGFTASFPLYLMMTGYTSQTNPLIIALMAAAMTGMGVLITIWGAIKLRIETRTWVSDHAHH